MMRSSMILALCLVGCNSAILPKRVPHVSLYETQRARWALQLQMAANGSGTPDVAPQPAPPASKCDCPAVCASDPAFPCDCTEPNCTNKNCRKSVKRLDAPESEPPKAEPPKLQEVSVDPPAIAAADMFTLWRENLPPKCLVVTTQPGCVPCRTVAKEVVAPLVSTGWHVVYLDITHSPELADRLKVTSTPVYIGFSHGKEVGRCPNPKDPPLTKVWGTITSWFNVADATSGQYDADVIIANWYKGRNFGVAGVSVSEHLKSHGVPEEVIRTLTVDKQFRLHSAIHEMESASGPISTAVPAPPPEE